MAEYIKELWNLQSNFTPKSSGSSRLIYENGGLHVHYGDDDGKGPTKPTTATPTPKPKPSGGDGAQGKAETKYREAEFVLEGQLTLIADPNIESNKTIEIDGVGEVLSGNYYVESVTHVWSRSGYFQDLELRTNTYGAIKPPATNPSENNTRDSKQPITPIQEESQYHTVKPGETLWSIATHYYGNGSDYTRIVDANKITNPNLIRPGDRLLIP